MNEIEQPPTLPERDKGYDLASRGLLSQLQGSQSYRQNVHTASVETH